MLDDTTKTITIASEDTVTFADKSVTVVIELDQSDVTDAGQLRVDVAFAADDIVFNTSDLTVEPLTCTELDE